MISPSGSCQAALNAELAEIRRIQTSMAQVGKLDYVKSNCQTFTIKFCVIFVDICNNESYAFSNFNSSQHHDDIQATLILMGQVEFFCFWLLFQVPSLLLQVSFSKFQVWFSKFQVWFSKFEVAGPGKVEAGSETKD